LPPIAEETANHRKHLVAAQSFMSLYSQKLDDRAMDLVSELKQAVKAAQAFLVSLKSEEHDLPRLLSELAKPQNFEAWETFLHQSPRSVFGKFMGWMSAPWSHRARASVDDLRGALQDIITTLHERIQSASCRVCKALKDGAPWAGRLTRLVLRDKAMDVVLCFEMFKMERGLALIKRLLSLDTTLGGQLARTQESIVHAFKAISSLPEELVQSNSFNELGEVLALWKKGTHVWQAAKSFSVKPLAPAQDYEVEARREALRDAIRNCPEYENVWGDILESVNEAQRRMKDKFHPACVDCRNSRLLSSTF
jgi:hypothetical protein